MKSLPRHWQKMAGPGCIAEADLRVTPHGRLRAKLLVFRNRLELRRFWKHRLRDGQLDRRTLGAVNMLAHWIEHFDENGQIWKRRIDRLDPRYFCVIGLVRGHLNMEIVSHEAGHAGFCYAKRVRRAPWLVTNDFHEEEVCYPSGRIAAAINRFLYRKGLYE